jgi:hypothetical protein
MHKVFLKIGEELRELIPPVIFFFVTLHLVAWVHTLMLKGTGIAVGTSLSVTIGALILGKAVLIADLLPFINRYPDKPLIYNVAWKTAIYVLVALLIHYVEELIGFWRQTGAFIPANRKLFQEIVWSRFWAIQVMLMMLILMYCTMHELSRVMGAGRMRELFFGVRPSARGVTASVGDIEVGSRPEKTRVPL